MLLRECVGKAIPEIESPAYAEPLAKGKASRKRYAGCRTFEWGYLDTKQRQEIIEDIHSLRSLTLALSTGEDRPRFNVIDSGDQTNRRRFQCRDAGRPLLLVEQNGHNGRTVYNDHRSATHTFRSIAHRCVPFGFGDGTTVKQGCIVLHKRPNSGFVSTLRFTFGT